MGLDSLKSKYPWPDSKPKVDPDPHGWFGECNEKILSIFLNREIKIVLELGSWLGKSTRFILEKAPQATVLAVDHWLGTKQITDDAPDCLEKLPKLYETFLVNCWEHRERLVPIKQTTIEAMKEIHSLGIHPEVIYLDAAHDFENANADLDMAMTLFPDAIYTGDDFSLKWDGVMKTVWSHAETSSRGIVVASHAWAIVKNWRTGSLDLLGGPK